MSAKHLNLSTVVDKNKIDSDKAFLILFKADIKDWEGNTIDTVRFCKNSENVIYKGDTFVAANFNLNIELEADKEPSVKLTAQDHTRALASLVEGNDGLIKSAVTLYIVHEDSLDGPAEMEEEFLVTNTEVNNYVVSFTLGTETAVAQRFPNYRQFRNRCAWKYKGNRCQYTGELPTCDYSRDGPNGCIAHNNEVHFGGFPGLNDLF